MTGEGLVWSPDGERLAFTTFVEPSRARIEMVAADGSAHTRIAQFVVPFSSTLGPSWSPDGRRVAYSRGFGTGPPRVAPGNPSNGPAVIPGRLNIVVAGASRRTERRLTRSRRSEFDPLWSPRGSEILFGRRIGRERAGLFVAAPGRPERRLAADLVVAPAAWSPDGRTVAFLRVPFFGDRRYHLFVVDVNTRRMRKLADRVATVRPSWSPDGRRIAFAGLDGIRTVSPEGGSSELLVHVREHVGEIAWSPDGVSLAFTVSRIPDD
jgi:Tol biopolymer transport system component